MKIARIETFLFDPGTAKNLLFCRVETDSGLHGWGEAYVTPGKEPVIEHLLRHMGKYMIGRSAFSIRHTAQVMFDDFAMRRASLDLMSAWSAIESRCGTSSPSTPTCRCITCWAVRRANG